MKKICRMFFSRYAISAIAILIQVMAVVYLFVTAASAGFYISLASMLFSVIAFLSLVNRETNPEYKIPWSFIILALTPAGAILYFLFYKRKLTRKETKRLKTVFGRMRRTGLSGDSFNELVKADPAAEGKARLILKGDVLAEVYGKTESAIFNTGEDYFVALKKDLKEAEKYIFLEYFIINEGRLWSEIHEILKNKVREGVEVRLLYDDVKAYGDNGLDGIIQCGSQRALFPSALRMYTFAMAMYDKELSYEEIEADYLYHLYGEDWKDFRAYLLKLEEALPFDFFSRDSARLRKSCHTDSVMAKSIARIREITKEGRRLIKEHYNSDYRVRTVGVRLLEKHAEYCDLTSDWIGAKARGEFELAKKLFEIARVEFGKSEVEIRRYFDHGQVFGEFYHTLAVESKSEVAGVQI